MMGIFRCPKDGRFLGSVVATISEDWIGQHVSAVRGVCKRHGQVEAAGEWCWEDFSDESEEG